MKTLSMNAGGKLLFCALTMAISHFSYSQQQTPTKSLGVGTATPNAHAALHVESPTGNQGFLLPRLTTQQRTNEAFTTTLAATDNGLLVYDSDMKELFIWKDTQWAKLVPEGGEGGSGGQVIAQITGTGAAVYGSTTGTGSAGVFSVSNDGNSAPAVSASTDGTGSAIQVNHTTGGVALQLVTGNIRLSTLQINVAGPISQRSAIYDLTAGGPHTLSFTASEGEIVMAYNSTGDPITIEGVNVPFQEVVQLIFIDGDWRQF